MTPPFEAWFRKQTISWWLRKLNAEIYTADFQEWDDSVKDWRIRSVFTTVAHGPFAESRPTDVQPAFIRGGRLYSVRIRPDGQTGSRRRRRSQTAAIKLNDEVLPDVLEPGLRVVFCGTAAGSESARRRAYYAGPGNRFWLTLFEIGLTPRVLSPAEFRVLPQFGIGLTDVVKGQHGSDDTIDFIRADVEAFEKRIIRYAPSIVCFNGKRAAQVYSNTQRLDYGLQPTNLDHSRLVVAPSTSAAARRYWDRAVWEQLAELCRA